MGDYNMQIITQTKYFDSQLKWNHLFEIAQPSNTMISNNMDWMVRDGFDVAGTLLIGDLRVIKQETIVLETHPFPEWVIQLYEIGKKSGKVYAIIPKLSKDQLDQLNSMEYTTRITQTQNFLNDLNPEDFLAIEYVIGVNIKIPANVPHEFIALCTENENIPYCQVFEPNLEKIMKNLQISPAFFNLNKKISIR